MRRGVDYSYRPDSWPAFFDALVAAGYTAIIRYLYDDYDPRPGHGEKRVTREELEAAWARGIITGFWWETSEGAALAGYNRGVDHAKRALRQLDELGLPADLPVFYCVDTDVSWAQCAGSIAQYFLGVRSVVEDVERIGVYGGLRPVKHLLEAGLAKYAAQTEAWSRFKPGTDTLNGRYDVTWYPGAQIHQWTEHAPTWCQSRSLDALDIMADCGLYHPDNPEGDDELDASLVKIIKQGRLSDVARSYDVEIIRAEIRGDAELVAKLEADKLQDLEDVRKALGLD